MADDMDAEGREVETLIEDWNASRVDIFAISKPDDNLEFSGVMRFYFQEPGAKDRKVATKCIRVNSSHTTEEVMKILVEKFHPDLKMLTSPNYSLYEVHETGTEARKLDLDEKPLYVQLYWQESDRDGRFLLKSEEEQMTTQSLFDPNEQNFKRRLSKREKKEMKKKRRIQAKQGAAEKTDGNEIAKQLYGDRPTSGLTRSLSNPEAVMRKRREMRLLKKMEQYEDTETNPGGGGPLRIFAESLQPEIPYKTLLFSNHHTTDHVLRTALEKYEVPAEEMDMYCLTMVTIFPGNQSDIESAEIKERVVHDDDCPLAIASSWPENKGEIRFYIKKKESMPKSKRAAPKRVNPQTSPSPAREASPPPVIETTFDITDVPSNEKEPVSSPPVQSPPVHVVDSSHALPASLEFHESGEDAFFAVVVSEVNGSAVHFKLAPTYTLYMCCRYRLSPKFRPDFPPNKRRENVAMTANKVANMMWQTVKENTVMAGHLAFWMANASEFLHFLKQDEDLSAMTEESQKILAHTTQQAFRSIVQCIKTELQGCLPAFLDPSDESDYEEGENDLEGEQFDPNEGYLSTERSFRVKNFSPNGRPIGGDQWMGKRKKASRPVVGDVLHTLSSAMSLLRRCRVNAALTLQLFSQLFHYINMFLFNRLVLEPQLQLCTRAWGVRLMQRLGRIQDWAENLGVEMAAECHLGRATQAAFLLQVPKQDTAVISSHCYKLNSLQLRQLLELYEPERDEPEIPVSLIDNVVAVAENTADSLARDEGQEVRLEEEPDLHLPFLLPEDGYSSEQIRGVPPGLREFLEPLIKPGLCRLTIQTKASGLWTVHFKSLDPEIPPPEASPAKELTKITINKGGKGMGVSIVAAKGVGQERSGIYVKEIVEGGPAYLDGRLKPGDQILEVNGESLIGITQEDAVKVLIKAGQVVNMSIYKAAVWQHGLALLLKQPATVNKVESVSRNVEPPSNLALKKDNAPPRAPPRYRTQHDGAPRSPVNTRNVTEGSEPSSPKQGRQPDPRQRRRSPYDSEYKDWKNQVQHDGPPEQASVSTKATVEYKQDEVSLGQKLYKAPVPYANPQDIQRRQKEMQDRKLAEERREQENMERERIRRDDEERQERERQERERQERERQEHERIKREEIARREQREREQKEREQREREQREQKERERIQREELEQQERRERERIDRERIDREELERKKRDEREQIQREEMERKEREKREEQEKKEREERERRKFQERELDEMSRHERELEIMLDQKRRDKEKRLQELRRQLEEEEAEAEGMEREYRERMSKKRDERVDPQRSPVPKEVRLPAAANTQVHYVSDQGKGREIEESKRETARAEEQRMPARRVDYGKRQQIQNQESLDIDPMEVERQFQQRLAQEERKDEPDGGNFVTVIRVPVQQDNWESPEGGDYGSGDRAENTRKRLERVDIDPNGERPEADVADRPRARVDWQRNEDERYRKEAQLKREQDEQLVREFQKSRTVEGESYRQQPVGAGVEPNYPPRQADWEKDDELRRQREEDDRLREARANQLRNRCIEKPEDDEGNRSYVNGRTKRVKFATVRTEITQPSPDIELAKAGVKFVHDGKVADSEDEDEFRRPPPPEDEDEAPPLRPPPPPKPQYLVNNKMNGSPAEYPSYRDNEPFINAQPQARMTEQEMRYATYPGRQQHNNNYPVPKPRVPRNVDSKSPPSPDQARLPFKDKMKVFNENTPPKKQTTSRWERDQNTNINGDTL